VNESLVIDSPGNDSGLLFQLARAEEVEEARESVRREGG
jgi:hypothetical protein